MAAGVWLLELRYDGFPERNAVRASAVVALATQLVAYLVARLGARRNVIAAWAAGSMLRLAVVVVWGIVAVRALQLPAEATLISVAALLFVSTVVEPWFLKA